MPAYYNEIDPYAAQWLRNLIDQGIVACGDVDERSIVDVRADDLRGYTQAHFFAGIGGWSIALRLAGWPDDRPVWTGSCPCQPFSAAGAGKAADDERHLWPAWFPLIAERKPPIVFGEQVEAAVGWGWLDAVFADVEGEGYACGATVLPACGVGAPHIRQRVWFVADAQCAGVRIGPGGAESAPEEIRREVGQQRIRPDVLASGDIFGPVADADGRDASAEGLQRGGQHGQRAQGSGAERVGDAGSAGLQERERDGRIQREALGPQPREAAQRGSNLGALDHSADARHDDAGQHERRPPLLAARPVEPSPVGGFWSDAEWIACTDGKARPVGPGSFPLGHGIQRRASKLRAYGNAIVPQVAAEFIRATRDIIESRD